MSKKWMASGYLKSKPSGETDHEKGIIKGVSVCTVGEAKGHGVNLDSEFIQEVTRQGGGLKQGLKARFGHPNMCSTALGTFIGRFKNFREEGTQALADLYLSNSAKETPNGNLFDYVLSLAENDADMFGTSIVFTRGREYKKDYDNGGEKVFSPYSKTAKGERCSDCDEWNEIESEIYVECETLHACDAVDEPAANDGGLFSAWAQETVAGQLTEFLDINPEVWEVLKSNPSIVEALASHGDKMDEFITRYRAYRAQNGKDIDMSIDKTNAEPLEESSATGTEEAESAETNSEETTPAESGEATEEAAEPETTEEAEPLEAMSRKEFKQIKDEFGADIAADTFATGGSYQTALKAAYDKTKAENEAFKASDSELSNGGEPGAVVSVKNENKSLFHTGK